MSNNVTVGDEYSGLANLLANLIAKYADVLDIEDEYRKNEESAIPSNDHVIKLTQGSQTPAPCFLILAENLAA